MISLRDRHKLEEDEVEEQNGHILLTDSVGKSYNESSHNMRMDREQTSQS